jgi:hypothetical protein
LTGAHGRSCSRKAQVSEGNLTPLRGASALLCPELYQSSFNLADRIYLKISSVYFRHPLARILTVTRHWHPGSRWSAKVAYFPTATDSEDYIPALSVQCTALMASPLYRIKTHSE